MFDLQGTTCRNCFTTFCSSTIKHVRLVCRIITDTFTRIAEQNQLQPTYLKFLWRRRCFGCIFKRLETWKFQNNQMYKSVLTSHVSKEVLVVLHCSQWFFCFCCCLHLLGSLHSLLSASHGNPARKAWVHKKTILIYHRSHLITSSVMVWAILKLICYQWVGCPWNGPLFWSVWRADTIAPRGTAAHS